MIAAIITILGGILAAAGFFIERKPNAKELIDKITPYQGWIGIILFLWGVWQTISVLLCLGWISSALIFWLIWVVLALSNLFLGFLLGFGLISKYALSKSEEAMAKGEQIRTKLFKFQVPLGFISIAIGLMYLFFSMGLWMIAYIAFLAVIITYIILVLVIKKPKAAEASTELVTPAGASNPPQKQTATATTQTTAPLKAGTYYEVRLSNVTCNPVGATFKVGLTVTAKKFVVDAKTGQQKEEIINDEIQIGMVKNGKEIYLKSYKFTKTDTSLSLTLDQKPDKIGIDPYNKLPERA